MKIIILTYGSRGDVQPFVALAHGLQKRGHEVKLAAPHRFASFVDAYGVPFVPLAGDPEEISRRINNAGTNAVKIISAIWGYIFAIAPQVSRSAFQACEGADLLVHSFLFTVGAHSWAREHDIPDVSVQTFPMFAPTRDFPSVAMPYLPPGVLSYLSHWFATQVFWYGGNTGYGPARRANPDIPYPKKLYWPFDNGSSYPRTPILCAWSPTVLPPPRDWHPDVHVTGYYFLDADPSFKPPTGLLKFLDAGDAPVCISFGSTIHRSAKEIDQVVRDALKQNRQRGIVLSGWNDIHDGTSDDVFYCDAVPHDWLLPRCKMMINHGGAGTIAAGLRAGIPTIVVPFTSDQPFWARRIHTLGAGPKPVYLRNLSVMNLAQAMLEAEDESLCKHAQVLGQEIRGENGVGHAATLIEAHESRFKSLRIFKV